METAYLEALRSVRGNPCPRTVVPRNVLEARNWDILAALSWVCRRDPLAALREALRNMTGRQHILFTPSGQCAIAQLLAVLPQREVVMPACTCAVVRTAAEVAGKRVIYVDLAKNSVNATSTEYAEAAKPGRILLATHLWGVPTDIEAICELAKDRNCVVIEDAVPALGSRRNGRLLGTFADFGIFSFQRSKRFPAFGGGAILVNNEQAVDLIRLSASRIVKSKRTMPFRELVEGLVYNVATTPWIYGTFVLPLLLRRHRGMCAPETANEQTASTSTSNYTREFHPYQAQLVLRMLKRMDQVREQIARLAAIYLEAFRNTSVSTYLPWECDNAGLMRFPIALSGKDRGEILRLALKRGVYLAANYGVLAEKSEYARFPNALWAARNLVLLPLYRALSTQSAELLAHRVIEIDRTIAARLVVSCC
jgi:dTDP-4-amino-4,6-dideoxygalactose transaminase